MCYRFFLDELTCCVRDRIQCSYTVRWLTLNLFASNCSEKSGCRNSLRPAGGDVAFRRGRTATKASRDPAVSAPEGGVAEIAVRAPRHDVIRRGWLAAILLLVLACSLLGKQRKCFGGLSICSGGSPSPVVLRAPPPPASCSPSSDQASAETLEVRTHTQLDTLADWF